MAARCRQDKCHLQQLEYAWRCDSCNRARAFAVSLLAHHIPGAANVDSNAPLLSDFFADCAHAIA